MRRRLLRIWVAVCIGWAGLIGWAYALNPRGGSIAPPDRSALTHYVLVGAAPLTFGSRGNDDRLLKPADDRLRVAADPLVGAYANSIPS
jgi:hypothetical protein